MTEEEKQMMSIVSGDPRAIVMGEKVYYPMVMVGGRSFQFDGYQNAFLFYLSKYNGDMTRACNQIAKPLEWAQKFMSTRKFREFRNAKLQILSINNGALLEEWREMGVAGMRGYFEWYEAKCALCHEDNKYSVQEAEGVRQDDMSLKGVCKVCLQPVAMEYKKEEFHPSREQVQFWAEIGQRVSPKIERVQHEFSSETFSFQTEDAS